MGNVIGTILPEAIGVAISPVPIIAVIFMLFRKPGQEQRPRLPGWQGVDPGGGRQHGAGAG